MSATPQLRRRRWRRYALEAMVVLAVFLGIQAWHGRTAVRGIAPQLYGPGLNGDLVSLEEPPGKLTVVHFWATWCSICDLMDGNIQGLSEDYRVLGVALRSGDGQAVAAHMRENGLSFETIVDQEGINAAQWGIRGVPTTFVVAADGSIREVTVGYSTSLGLRARVWLAGRAPG